MKLAKASNSFVQASIEKEYSASKVNERHFVDYLNKTFKTQTFKPNSRYDFFDVRCKKNKVSSYFELKSRRNKINTFPTTIVGTDKVKYAQNKISKGLSKNKIRKNYYVFEFLNKYYYLEHNDKLFSTFKTKLITRRDRNVTKEHTEIPVNLLKPISELEI